MAFKNFSPRLGIWRSEWVGFYNFSRFFNSPNFINILRNILVLSLYGLVAGFPFPLIIAICVNHFIWRHFKKTVQTITFAPYFLSAVVIVGLITQILAIDSGAVNMLLKSIGANQII
jgi:multiple sugar transport system permease protein/putative aldouronate transport system permease protein